MFSPESKHAVLIYPLDHTIVDLKTFEKISLFQLYIVPFSSNVFVADVVDDSVVSF